MTLKSCSLSRETWLIFRESWRCKKHVCKMHEPSQSQTENCTTRKTVSRNPFNDTQNCTRDTPWDPVQPRSKQVTATDTICVCVCVCVTLSQFASKAAAVWVVLDGYNSYMHHFTFLYHWPPALKVHCATFLQTFKQTKSQSSPCMKQ